MAVGASAMQIKTDGDEGRLPASRRRPRPWVRGEVLAGRMIVRSYIDVDVNLFDPWMLMITPIPLVIAAFWACYIPAARAARVDPTVALRAE